MLVDDIAVRPIPTRASSSAGPIRPPERIRAMTQRITHALIGYDPNTDRQAVAFRVPEGRDGRRQASRRDPGGGGRSGRRLLLTDLEPAQARDIGRPDRRRSARPRAGSTISSPTPRPRQAREGRARSGPARERELLDCGPPPRSRPAAPPRPAGRPGPRTAAPRSCRRRRRRRRRWRPRPSPQRGWRRCGVSFCAHGAVEGAGCGRAATFPSAGRRRSRVRSPSSSSRSRRGGGRRSPPRRPPGIARGGAQQNRLLAGPDHLGRRRRSGASSIAATGSEKLATKASGSPAHSDSASSAQGATS